ncbi:hypothetical protein SAMN05661091_5378 [Paenibacillus uliginis N3/975]|uniref:Uncharacterized protein n=1 Tax=Paenibacillus uliginis N3/975 TaxID=1313296 RepID=A0A1X7HRK0_9BACL|nr:hypothetical protein [Paenibacillus uliginis]SMF91213.1 hypothetical protein SAMN05661091_5378 [Paenibacillus uliginis N3/975]
MIINYGAVSSYRNNDGKVAAVKEQHMNFENAEALRKFTEENPEALIRHLDVRNGNIFAQVQIIEMEDLK